MQLTIKASAACPEPRPGGADDGAAPASLRPEHLGEEEYAAIWALVSQGRLRPEAANLGHPPRQPALGSTVFEVSVGFATWALAVAGLARALA